MMREEEMYGLGERACFGYPATKQKMYKSCVGA